MCKCMLLQVVFKCRVGFSPLSTLTSHRDRHKNNLQRIGSISNLSQLVSDEVPFPLLRSHMRAVFERNKVCGLSQTPPQRPTAAATTVACAAMRAACVEAAGAAAASLRPPCLKPPPAPPPLRTRRSLRSGRYPSHNPSLCRRCSTIARRSRQYRHSPTSRSGETAAAVVSHPTVLT